jgi:hypothetical protein
MSFRDVSGPISGMKLDRARARVNTGPDVVVPLCGGRSRACPTQNCNLVTTLSRTRKSTPCSSSRADICCPFMPANRPRKIRVKAPCETAKVSARSSLAQLSARFATSA